MTRVEKEGRRRKDKEEGEEEEEERRRRRRRKTQGACESCLHKQVNDGRHTRTHEKGQKGQARNRSFPECKEWTFNYHMTSPSIADFSDRPSLAVGPLRRWLHMGRGAGNRVWCGDRHREPRPFHSSSLLSRLDPLSLTLTSRAIVHLSPSALLRPALRRR